MLATVISGERRQYTGREKFSRRPTHLTLGALTSSLDPVATLDDIGL